MPNRNETVPIQLVLNSGNFSKNAKTASRSLISFGNTAVKQSNRITRAFLAFVNPFNNFARALTSFRGIFFTIGIAKFVNIFFKLEKAILNVLTLVDDLNISFETFEDRLKAISNVTGLGFDDLGKALFDIVSAGNNAADSLEILSVASRLAVAGNTNVASSAKALVAIMKTYRIEVEDAIVVSDILFAAQKVGITTIQRLSNNVGKVAPTARTAGLSLRELSAAISALTLAGLSTDEAGTALRAILTTLIRPSEQAKEAARVLGIELNTAAIRGGRFQEFLLDVIQKTGGNAEILGQLFNNVRAFGGIANLTADDAEKFAKALDTVNDSANKTNDAFKEFEDSLQLNFNKFTSQFQSLAADIVKAFKPAFNEILEGGITVFQELRLRFLRNRIRIVATVQSIADRFVQLFELVKNQVKEGNLLNLIAGGVAGLFNGLLKLLLGFVPVIVSVSKLIGLQIGKALISGTLAEVASLNLGKEFLERAGLSEEVVAKLTRATSIIKELNSGVLLAGSNFSSAGNLEGLNAPPEKLIESVEAIQTFAEGLGNQDLAQKAKKSLSTLKQIQTNADAVKQFFSIDSKVRKGLGSQDEVLASLGFVTTAISEVSLREDLKKLRDFAKENKDAIQQLAFEGSQDAISNRLSELGNQALEDAKKIGPSVIQGISDGFKSIPGNDKALEVNLKDTFDERAFSTALAFVPKQFRDAFAAQIEFAVSNPFFLIPESARQKLRANLASAFVTQFSINGFLKAQQAEEEALRQKVTKEQSKNVGQNPATFDIQGRLRTLREQLKVLKEARTEYETEIARIQELADGGRISGGEAESRISQVTDNLNTTIRQTIVLYRELGIEIQANAEEQGKNNATYNFFTEELKKLNKELDKLRVSSEQGTFFSGLEAGIRNAAREFESFADVGVQVGQTLTNEIAGGLSSAFFQASDSFASFADQFLRRIGQMILQSLILKGINSAFGFGNPAPEIPLLRANSGTPSVPGPNVNRDVTPALLTPGEAVIRKEMAQGYYGRRIMAAINNGQIPREILEFFVGGSKRSPFKVSSSLFKFNSGSESVPSSGIGGFGINQAVLVSDEQDFDKLMANGGKKAMIKFFKENPELIRAQLGTELG